MKKSLYILLLFGFLYSCSDCETETLDFEWKGDWNDPTHTNYKSGGYNPLSNRWILISKNGKAPEEFLVYKFNSMFYFSQSNVEPITGSQPEYSEPIPYKLNEYQLMMGSTVYIYKISGEGANTQLTIQDGINTLTFSPYKSESWYWNGNWNSFENANYSKFKGTYNPLAGTWKLTDISNDIIKYSKYYQFTADFQWKKSMSAETNFELISKFDINDTGFKTVSDDNYYEYRLSDANILEIYGRFENSNFYMKFVKNN